MKTDLIKEVTVLLKHCFKYIADTGSAQYIQINEKYNINILKTETVNFYPNIELNIEDIDTVVQIISSGERGQKYRCSVYDTYLNVSYKFDINKIAYKTEYTHDVIEDFKYNVNKDEYDVIMFNANLLYDSKVHQHLELAYEVPKLLEAGDFISYTGILQFSTEELQDLVLVLKKFITENVPVKLEDL